MTTNWIDAAAQADVPEGDVIGVIVAGKDIALYEVEGEVFATDTAGGGVGDTAFDGIQIQTNHRGEGVAIAF